MSDAARARDRRCTHGTSPAGSPRSLRFVKGSRDPQHTETANMTLITATERAQLIANGIAQRTATNSGTALDFYPVVKLFTPDANATWLLSELDPEDPDLAFGLCDLGLGEPELGYVRLSELVSVRGPLGLPIERDQYFTADKLISAYAARARSERRIAT